MVAQVCTTQEHHTPGCAIHFLDIVDLWIYDNNFLPDGRKVSCEIYFLHKGEVWAVTGSALYKAEYFEQLGSVGKFATCPLCTCMPNRAMNIALGHCLKHMA